MSLRQKTINWRLCHDQAANGKDGDEVTETIMEQTVRIDQAIVWAQSAAEIGRNVGTKKADYFVTPTGVESLPDHIARLITDQIKAKKETDFL